VKRYCVLLVSVALLVAVAVCVGQVPAPAPEHGGVGNAAAGWTRPSPPPPATAKAETREKSIEELLGRLDSIKAQQEELEKARKETVALVKEKLKQQKQRLQKLGVEEEPVAPPAVPAVVGQSADPLVGESTRGVPVTAPEAPARNGEKR
jgi:hypothetical protein